VGVVDDGCQGWEAGVVLVAAVELQRADGRFDTAQLLMKKPCFARWTSRSLTPAASACNWTSVSVATLSMRNTP
jgi:hypothetical protein